MEGVKSSVRNLSGQEAIRQWDPMHRTRLFVLGPRGTWKDVQRTDPSFVVPTLTRDIPPYDRLEGYNLRLPDKDGAALQLFPVLVHFLRHLLDAQSHDVIWDDMLKLVEPEDEDSAFVWDPLAMQAVE